MNDDVGPAHVEGQFTLPIANFSVGGAGVT